MASRSAPAGSLQCCRRARRPSGCRPSEPHLTPPPRLHPSIHPPQGPVLKGGVLCTAQEALPDGLSREGSLCERRPAPHGLAAALRDDWVGGREGPLSFPLRDAAVAEADEEEQEALPADLEDEFEGGAGGGELRLLVVVGWYVHACDGSHGA